MKPKEPTFEDIQFLTEITKKLTSDETSAIYYMLSEWSYAAGFANGMLSTLEPNEGIEN